MMSESRQVLQQSDNPALMMGMLIVAVFFSMAARAIYSPLMPALQHDLGLTLSTAGFLFFIVSLSYAPAILCSGFLAARIGHGNTIVAALASLTLGLLLTATAPGIALLAAGMLFIGAGAGAYPPSGLVMISTKISVECRSAAFALHEMGPNLALLLCPLIVLALEPLIGWRGVLLFMAAICGISAAAFLRWGAVDSGVGAAPNLSAVATVLRMRGTYVGMAILSAALGGLQGVYAILPAFLVAETSLSAHSVNFLLTVSRVASVLLLLRAGAIIRRFGKRRTMIWIMLFTGLFTALIGIVKSSMVTVAVIVQPALLTVLFPALLSSLADIGESRYQNLTYGIIITVGVGVGGGLIPLLLGLCGDLGLGWLGFLGLAAYMGVSVLVLLVARNFGTE